MVGATACAQVGSRGPSCSPRMKVQASGGELQLGLLLPAAHRLLEVRDELGGLLKVRVGPKA